MTTTNCFIGTFGTLCLVGKLFSVPIVFFKTSLLLLLVRSTIVASFATVSLFDMCVHTPIAGPPLRRRPIGHQIRQSDPFGLAHLEFTCVTSKTKQNNESVLINYSKYRISAAEGQRRSDNAVTVGEMEAKEMAKRTTRLGLLCDVKNIRPFVIVDGDGGGRSGAAASQAACRHVEGFEVAIVGREQKYKTARFVVFRPNGNFVIVCPARCKEIFTSSSVPAASHH